jgi:hypothetical protein
MILTTIAAIVAAAKGVSDLYTSYSTSNDQPEYTIPKAAQDSLNTAKYIASMKELPGQSLMEDQLRSNTAQGLKAIQQTTPNSSSTLGALAQLYANQQKGVNSLNIAGAQNYVNNQKYLAGQEQNYAKWEEQKANWDIYQPYIQEMKTKSDFEKSGWANIMNSLNNVASYKENEKMWGDYLKSFNGSLSSINPDNGKMSYENPYKYGYPGLGGKWDGSTYSTSKVSGLDWLNTNK